MSNDGERTWGQAMHALKLIADQDLDSWQTNLLAEYLPHLARAVKRGTVPSLGDFRQAVGLVDPLNSLVVSVDYAHTIASLIKKAAFDYDYVDFNPDQFSVMSEGEHVRNVEELYLGRTVTGHEILEELEGRDKEFADPHTALVIACQYPDEQRNYPLAILFKDRDGRPWSLFLRGSVGKRGLKVDCENLNSHWDPNCRFLVVPKPS